MKITAVVASYEGTKKWLPLTMHSLHYQEMPFDRVTVDESDRNTTHKWNDAIQNCESEYLALPHADDVYGPQFVSEMVAYLDSHPECASVFCLDRHIDEHGNVIGGSGLPFQPQDSYDFRFVFENMLRYGNFLRCPSVVHRVSMVRKYRHDLSDANTANDTAFWFKILNDHPIGIIPKPLYDYRICKDSDTQKNVIGTEKQFDHMLAMIYAARLRTDTALAAPQLAKLRQEAIHRAEEDAIRGAIGTASGIRFCVVHEPPGNAGTGILVQARVRGGPVHPTGETPVYVFPVPEATDEEIKCHEGIAILPIKPERFHDALEKHKPKVVEYHHLMRWPLNIIDVPEEKHLFLHDAWLWCARWHSVNQYGQVCNVSHAMPCNECASGQEWAKTWERREYVRERIGSFKGIYANSPYLAEAASGIFKADVGVHEWPIPIVGSPVMGKRVGYFGAWYGVKGTDLLLRVAITMPDTQFLFFCDPPEDLHPMMDGRSLHGCPNILFLGPYRRRDLRGLSNLVDLVVVPSRCESFGLVKREMEILGKKVVATSAGGLGGTVTPNDADALRKAICES